MTEVPRNHCEIMILFPEPETTFLNSSPKMIPCVCFYSSQPILMPLSTWLVLSCPQKTHRTNLSPLACSIQISFWRKLSYLAYNYNFLKNVITQFQLHINCHRIEWNYRELNKDNSTYTHMYLHEVNISIDKLSSSLWNWVVSSIEAL